MLSVLKYFREILFQISLLLPQMKSERWDEEKLESYQPTCCVWSLINIWEEPALPSNVISWHTQKINRICDEVKKKRRSEMALSSNEHKICVNCICFEIKNSVSVYVIRQSLSPSLLPQSFFSLIWRFRTRMETIFSILHGAKFANSPLSRDRMSQFAWASRLRFFDQEKTICAKRRTKRFNYIN
jgi:hypothetical protein